MSKRKRGPRKSKPPKRVRMAMQDAAQEAAMEAEIAAAEAAAVAAAEAEKAAAMAEAAEAAAATGDEGEDEEINAMSQSQRPNAANWGGLLVRYQEYMNLRVQEGYEIARRLARNCPRPVRFSTVWSTCFEQKSYKWTNWHEVVRPSAMVHDIRSRIQQIGEKKITIVIRAIDGLTCIEEDFGGFLTMVINEGKDAQIVFQMEKGL
ncbi:uncharacterized protein SETTUDRAFT_28618 [Exserohilum turcica Et28A]|uniref:Uncharacterized protein n=1 Tax=Exserohilum turcicum (strain 28A) TaxID=671987 RepID=R0IMI7_EXST2|nr:uncharacterized protein SETTUDRAFT_28618 [Exserohilum turcica Et28A]EOA86225.1 hypothetical protein SETTUDRAFT_28618 [Exserohilum turcica Et28A]